MPRETAPSWTEAEDEWLRECYPLYPNAELTAFKAEDGWPRVDSERRARIAAGRPRKGDLSHATTEND